MNCSNMSADFQVVAVRTDRDHRDTLLDELKNGRLRQGWGYADRLDLRVIEAKPAEERDSEERDCWRGNRRLLSTQWDGLKEGDLVLLPNMPEKGLFCLAKVTSNVYRFDPLSELTDFGHIRDVQLLTPEGVHPLAEPVDATLRRSLKCRSRMWNIKCRESIQEILQQYAENPSLLRKPKGEAARMLDIYASLRHILDEELQRKFHGHELEKPFEKVFETIYGNCEHTGGRSERGADLRCNLEDKYGSVLKIVIQIKDYRGSTAYDIHAVNQIKQAYENDEFISKAVIITFLDDGKAFQEGVERLQREIKIPIDVLTRNESLDLMLAYYPWQDATPDI